MTDRTTKALLLAIALGLWVNVVSDWIRPTVAQAQSAELPQISRDLRSIALGSCVNTKIC
jgi:hypothetical protein